MQVYLEDVVAQKAGFDVLWTEWIGGNPDHWPMQSCVQVTVTGGNRIELLATAAAECFAAARRDGDWFTVVDHPPTSLIWSLPEWIDATGTLDHRLDKLAQAWASRLPRRNATPNQPIPSKCTAKLSRRRRAAARAMYPCPRTDERWSARAITVDLFSDDSLILRRRRNRRLFAKRLRRDRAGLVRREQGSS